MARDISPKEAFDEKVDELTVKHYEQLHHKLQGHDLDTTELAADALADKLDFNFLKSMAVQSAFGALAVGGMVKAIVEKALQAEAEVLAIAEAEQLERDRKESQDEARAERALSQ